MTSASRERLDELLADKVLWGLADDEERELACCAAEATSDLDADLTAMERAGAALAIALLAGPDAVAAPASVLARARDAANRFLAHPDAVEPARSTLHLLPSDARRAAGVQPWVAWSGWVAAAATLLVAIAFGAADGHPTPSLEAQLESFLAARSDVVRMHWDSGPQGDVIWSPSAQAGYLLLRGLPRNDPGRFQYQLWIFDRERQPETPVDGGVFDLADAPTGAGAATDLIVPIDPKIFVHDAFAFAITKEAPGGVVVSDKRPEQIVAAAGL